MSLFYIDVWKKNDPQTGSFFWQDSIEAPNVEEAYKTGKDQFQTDNPDLDPSAYTFGASGYPVEK